MIGRFIFLCDTEHFDVACDAAKYLLENPEQRDVFTTQTDGDGINGVTMFAKRLKKSIRVQQVNIRDELLHRIDEALRSVAPHPAAEQREGV